MGWLAGCGQVRSTRTVRAGEVDKKPAPLTTDMSDTWPLFRGQPTCVGLAGCQLPDKPEVVWRKSFQGSSFEATATIVDSTIYLGALLGGDFYALDLATGEEKWKHHTELGFKSAAAVRDGVVYVGDTDGTFFAFDAAHGDVLWSMAVNNEINGANFYKDRLLITCEDGKLYCVELADGKKVWSYSIDSPLRCSPCVSGDHGFLAGCDGRLHVVDLTDGSGYAQIELQDPTLSTPAAVGDMVYFGTQGGRFCGVNWREKEIKWNFEPKNKGQQVKSSAAVAEGLVLFGGKDRLIHAINAATGDEVWSMEVKAPMDSSPVVAGSRVFVGTDRGQLVSVDLKTGENLWQYEAGGRFDASPAVAAGKLVIGNDAGDLYCFGEK
jgi:outer membrane protein assembly factor BamB